MAPGNLPLAGLEIANLTRREAVPIMPAEATAPAAKRQIASR
jgi:hypothetical protein